VIEVLYVAFAAVELLDFGRVNVKADDPETTFDESKGQWQAHIAHADDANHGFARLYACKKRFSVRVH
jgi:hypothetical protein